MKKFILIFALLGAFGLNASYAQCSQAKAAGCCKAKVAKAAAADNSIEQRTADNGEVAYVRKEVDTDGNARFVSVQYDETAAKFVNVAPPAAAPASTATKKTCTTNKAACCSKGAKKASCAGKAEAHDEQ